MISSHHGEALYLHNAAQLLSLYTPHAKLPNLNSSSDEDPLFDNKSLIT